jgi:hypothetical protein
LTFAALNSGQENDEYDEKLLRWFSKYRPYWDNLIRCNAQTRCGGVGIYSSENSYKKQLAEGEAAFSWIKMTGVWDTQMMKVGLTLSNDQDAAKVLFLHSETVDYMSDEDINKLFMVPVVTDCKAILKLIKRGYEKNLGVRIEPINNALGSEWFAEHSVNTSFVGEFCKESFFINQNDPTIYKILDCDKNTEVLGVFLNDLTNESIGTVSAIVSTYDSRGDCAAKWAVFGYCFGHDLINSKKRNQIINAVDYICNNTLPAKLISNEQIVVIPRVDANEKTVSVSLLSCTIGTSDKLKLAIRNPINSEFKIMGANTEEQKIDFEMCGTDFIVELPPLGPWEMLTVFCR